MGKEKKNDIIREKGVINEYPIYIRQLDCWELVFNNLMEWHAETVDEREGYKASIPVSLDSLRIERLFMDSKLSRGIKTKLKALPGRDPERKPADQYMTPYAYPEHKKFRYMNALVSVDFTKEPMKETIYRCGDLALERGLPENLTGENTEVISNLLKEFSNSRKVNREKYNAFNEIEKSDSPDEFSGDEFNETTSEVSDKMPQEVKESFKNLKIKFLRLMKALKEEPRQSLYQNGFDVETKDGVCHYVRYKRSASKAKEGSCLFIWEPLYKKMREWTWLGLNIKKTKMYDLTSMLAYESLVQSSIVNTVKIPWDSILIIDAVESQDVPGNRRIMVKGEDGDVDLVTEDEFRIRKGEKYQRTNKIWDGQALVDESVFVDAGYVKTYEQVEQGKGDKKEIKIIEKDNRHGMMLLRNSFFKACGFRTRIQDFYREYYGEEVKEVIDHFGRTVDATKVKMIITPDSLKLLKFAEDFFPKSSDPKKDMYEYWRSHIDEEFGIVKTDKASQLGHGKYNEMRYQLLNTLPLSEDDIKILLQKELDFMKLLRDNRAVFLYWMRNVDISLRKKYCMYWMYRQNEEFGRTKDFKDYRNEEIQDYRKRLKKGKVKVQGDYYTLCSMPLEMLEYSVNRKIEPKLGPKEIYIQGAVEKSELMVLFRYPHLCSGSVCLMKTVSSEMTDRQESIDKYKEWFRFENCDGCNIVVISPWESNIMVRLGGADFDSDAALCVREEVIVNAAKKLYTSEIGALSSDGDYGPPVAEVDTDLLGEVKKYKYCPKDIAMLDAELAKSNVGQISNDAQLFNSYFWDGYFSGKEPDDYLRTVYNCVLKLAALNELEIDRSKHSIDLKVDEIRKKIRNTPDPYDPSPSSRILKYQNDENKEGGAKSSKKADDILLPSFLYDIQGGKYKATRDEDNGFWQCPVDLISIVLDKYKKEKNGQDKNQENKNQKNTSDQNKISVDEFLDESCKKNPGRPYKPHVTEITAIWKQYCEETKKTFKEEKDREKRRRKNLREEALLNDAALAAAYLEPSQATMRELFKMGFEKEKKKDLPKYPELVGSNWSRRYQYLGFLFVVGEKLAEKSGKGNPALTCVRPGEKGEPCRLVYNPAGEGEIEIWGDTFDVK